MFFSLYYYVMAPRDHDLNIHESPLPQGVSTQITIFPFGLFPLYVPMLKFDLAFYGPNLPLDSWFEPTVFEDASIQATDFHRFFEQRTLKNLILYMYVPL